MISLLAFRNLAQRPVALAAAARRLRDRRERDDRAALGRRGARRAGARPAARRRRRDHRAARGRRPRGAAHGRARRAVLLDPQRAFRTAAAARRTPPRDVRPCRRAADRREAALPPSPPTGASSRCARAARCRRRRRPSGAPCRSRAGAWRDDDGDRRWSRPTLAELRHDIDHFHTAARRTRTPRLVGGVALLQRALRGSHAVGVRLVHRRRRRRGARERAVGRAGARHDCTCRARARAAATARRSAATPYASRRSDADLTIGTSTVRVLPNGDYAVHAEARAERGGEPIVVDLVVAPAAAGVLPGRDARERRLRVRLRRRRAARRRDRLDLRGRGRRAALRAIRRGAGVPRSQLGRVAAA